VLLVSGLNDLSSHWGEQIFEVLHEIRPLLDVLERKANGFVQDHEEGSVLNVLGDGF
jgi:hypothetical protein